ncbi:hypothetical protein [Pseudomonas sp. SCB32]|uniref:hypothetical protein n=1 Tax=Pseudomonas sp. SCB32 TaxID=2653853 RepID=UPI001264A6E5|nr:hypothetical protein [Pseudomonas sp. SCB32]
MSTDDKLNLDELSLVPMEPDEAAPAASAAPDKPKFLVDTRHSKERRSGTDRRQSIRFEADRRKGDRRAGSKDAWSTKFTDN